MKAKRSWTRRVRVMAGLAGLVLLFAGWTAATEPRVGPHSLLDMALMRGQIEGLDVYFGRYFVSAGRCAGCHGHDSLNVAMLDESGTDVNVVNDWRSTMMGNSARDPFFRAKIEHESLVDPAHAEELQNKCLGCHAPLGMHEERLLGHPPFTLAMLDTSHLGLDGVSCLACHMQDPDSAGHFFSGELHFDSARVFGPYPDAEINPAIMEFFVRYRPGYGEHIQDGRVCAGCHGLITDTHDLDGNPTGGHFFEQATWQEWKNSVYPGEQNCRSCHLPRTDDGVILASEYAFLPAHSPFGKHHFAGGNTFMLRLMRDHKDELGIPATVEQFDSTIARSLRQLHSAVDLQLVLASRTTDTMAVDVRLTNLTGHKFPSGYPSRRAFVRVVATTDAGDTLFANGLIDGHNEVIGHDTGYEPHHDVITAEDQVQIYEMVMGDVNGDVTTVLERAAAPIKDDRLPPQGFLTTHPSYDTAQIAGVDPSDVDFNHDALGIEGSGGDVVHYHIPLHGFTGNVHVTASVHYQPVPPAWNAEMFSNTSAGIDTFRTMYDHAEGMPEQVADATLSDDRTGIHEASRTPVQVFPNPTADGLVTLTGEDIRSVTVYDLTSKRLSAFAVQRGGPVRLQLPEAAGTYQLVVGTPGGERSLRVVRLRK